MSARSHVQGTRGGPAFELDRFGLVGGDRYEVEGRWSGIRGRLFIRPELTLTNSTQSQRLLADLAQKPWQTADGEPWAVAFPCSDDPIDATAVELTVAPDITVTVKRGRARRTRADREDGARGPSTAAEESPESSARAETEAKAGGKRRGLGVQLAEAQSELVQLREQRAHLLDRLAAATRRADEARAERERVAAARDALLVERDQALAERDTATRLAAVDREAAQHTQDELEQARGALEQARGALEQESAIHNQTVAERDSAIRAGVEVERELHAAKAAQEDLLSDREQLLSQQKWLKGELKRLAAAQQSDHAEPERPRGGRRDPAVSRPAPLAPSASPPSVLPPSPLRRSPLPPPEKDDEWILGGRGRFSTGSALRGRALAIAALALAIVAVVLVLRLLL